VTAAPTTSTDEFLPQGTESVLIVEDEAAVRLLARTVPPVRLSDPYISERRKGRSIEVGSRLVSL